MPVKFRDDWFKIKYTYKTIVFGYWASTVVSLPPSLVIMASNLSKFGWGGGTSHILPASFKVETSYCVPPSSQLRGLSILSLFLQCWGTPYFTPQPPSFKVGTRFILCPQSLPPSQLRGFSIILSPLIQSRETFHSVSPTFSVKGTFHIVPLPSVLGDSIFYPPAPLFQSWDTFHIVSPVPPTFSVEGFFYYTFPPHSK